MSSQTELNEPGLDEMELGMELGMDLDPEMAELLEAEDTPPEAFYLALKQALSQLKHHNESNVAA